MSGPGDVTAGRNVDDVSSGRDCPFLMPVDESMGPCEGGWVGMKLDKSFSAGRPFGLSDADSRSARLSTDSAPSGIEGARANKNPRELIK